MIRSFSMTPEFTTMQRLLFVLVNTIVMASITVSRHKSETLGNLSDIISASMTDIFSILVVLQINKKCTEANDSITSSVIVVSSIYES